MGLFIAFSFSGIFLNHRRTWHPLKYESSKDSVQVKSAFLANSFSDVEIAQVSVALQIEDEIKRFGEEGNTVWVRYKNADLEFNKTSGKGTLKTMKTTPVLGQMTFLHITTNDFWICYSDVFGISMILLAITPLFFAKGRYGFKRYGWKLALAGGVFPLVFLFFLSG